MQRIVHIWLAMVLLVMGIPVLAQESSAPTIEEIEVVGALTVGSRQVKAWSGFDEGKLLTRDLAAQGIRNLFSTKKFSDVYLYQQKSGAGIKLTINLTEFPRIRSINFRGQEKVKDKDLRAAFPVHVGQFANPAAINRDLQPLRELYYDKGYYNVAMHTDSTRVDANNMEDLVVTITEGKKVKVKSISFKGNKTLSAGGLRDAMEQGTTGFLRSGTFKKTQFEEDRERIITYCRNQGFLDAAVVDVDLNLGKKGKDQGAPGEDGGEEETDPDTPPDEMNIVITLDEGERYFIGDVNWTGNTVFDDLAIANVIWMEKGGVFKEDEYLETLDNLQQIYADRGYIYITVEPARDIVDHVVNVDFTFIEGQPAHLHDVQISGNVKTYDNVILREMRIFPR